MNLLSLCGGIAGLDLGVKIALPEATTVCYVERDPYCQRVLMARMSDGSLDAAPIWPDLLTFDGRPWRGAVDLVVAGFPCQDISNAGRREGIREGNRSGLWFEVLRIVCEVRPRYVFLENVSALLVRGLDTVLGGLAESGFDAEWGLFSAADVGAPHLRKRVFILADARCGSDDEEQSEPIAWRSRAASASAGRYSLADAASEYGERGFDYGAGDGRSEAATGNGGGAVGNTTVAGLERRSCAGVQRGIVDPSGRELPDAEDVRGPAEQRLEPDGAGECLPVFPPGPADRAGWAAVLARAPHLEPAVRRVDARFTHRVDRLRCLGNAVVPLTAALAFEVLAERLDVG